MFFLEWSVKQIGPSEIDSSWKKKFAFVSLVQLVYISAWDGIARRRSPLFPLRVSGWTRYLDIKRFCCLCHFSNTSSLTSLFKTWQNSCFQYCFTFGIAIAFSICCLICSSGLKGKEHHVLVKHSVHQRKVYLGVFCFTFFFITWNKSI